MRTTPLFIKLMNSGRQREVQSLEIRAKCICFCLTAEMQASWLHAQVEERLAKQAQEAGGSFERGELSLSSIRQEELLTEDGGSSGGETETERCCRWWSICQ